MRQIIRAAAALGLAGGVLAGGLAFQGSTEVRAQVATRHVTIFDNGGSFAPGDANTGEWGYAPMHLGVTKGETIRFSNPASNTRPHTVTSITWSGTAFERALESGTKFNSSPDQASLLQPGSEWSLDTTEMDAGHYVFYCTLHPWMLGTFTVSNAD